MGSIAIPETGNHFIPEYLRWYRGQPELTQECLKSGIQESSPKLPPVDNQMARGTQKETGYMGYHNLLGL